MTLPANHEAIERACEHALALYHTTYGYSGTDVGPEPMLVAFREDDHKGVIARGVQLPGVAWVSPADTLASLARHAEEFGHAGFMMISPHGGGALIGLGLVVEGWSVADATAEELAAYTPDTHPRRQQVHQIYAHLIIGSGCYGYTLVHVEGEDHARVPVEDPWAFAGGELADALGHLTHALRRAQTSAAN